jgi:hypothetical protein
MDVIIPPVSGMLNVTLILSPRLGPKSRYGKPNPTNAIKRSRKTKMDKKLRSFFIGQQNDYATL